MKGIMAFKLRAVSGLKMTNELG